MDDNQEEVALDSFDEDILIPVNPSNRCYIHSVSAKELNIPRNYNNPVRILEVDHGEELAFPWLFPFGINGFKQERPIHLTPKMYFKGRLYHKDSRFRKNTTYLLHTAVSYDISCLKRAVNIKMKIIHSNQNGNLPVTLGNLRNLQTNPDLLENSYMFMKKIKGTVAYFKNMLYDLLATFRCLGTPTLFMTLSADDLHWPELGMSLENIDFNEACGKSFFHK